MTHRHFCTYFDRNYLVRALALHASLRQHGGPFTLWTLCLDDAAFEAVCELDEPDIVAIALGELEDADPALKEAKEDRTRIEYYFTLSPILPLHILDKNRSIPAITYLDSDLYFFSSAEHVFEEIADAPIAIIEHRFPPHLHDHERYGRFNVGWITFARSDPGIACLRWWRERCVEWCYDRVEDDRFADQKYLDRWPELFGDDVHVIEHLGANLAPWSLENHPLTVRGDQVFVGGQPLVFFHFQGLMHVRPWLVDPNVADYGTKLGAVARRRIFRPYLGALHDMQGRVDAETSLDLVSPRRDEQIRTWRRWPRIIRRLIRGEMLLSPLSNVVR